MSRVMSILSKDKEQMEEFKKIKNTKFDTKIRKLQDKIAKIEIEKTKFNEEVDKYLSEVKV